MVYILDPADTRARLEAAYGQFNTWYFGDSLPGAVIRIEQPSGECFGDCDFSGPGPVIRISPDLLTGQHPYISGGSMNPAGLFRLCADILLHEMAHARIRDGSAGGHNEHFARECQRIDGLLSSRRRSAAYSPVTVAACTVWPVNRRKRGYYLGCLGHGPTPASFSADRAAEDREKKKRRKWRKRCGLA